MTWCSVEWQPSYGPLTSGRRRYSILAVSMSHLPIAFVSLEPGKSTSPHR